ncbi:LysR family transcriptional regulator [Klebsiella pneumoniae]|uniref:LysR family transcriptional regulator n=1 Tax=Klebsiella pneumoniae TaxID=573 RepID=A0A377TR67_KLEPN|nr:LysR family transcriptional regulator [Klebsiella pneumoniae]
MAKRENYNDLYLFMQVVREGSFTAAAQRLGLAQSGVSRAVRELEERLGVQLLVRTTRRLSLTQAGEQLYHNVESGFDALDMGLATLAHYRQTPSGTVRINASQHAIDKVLLPKLAVFKQRYPDIRLELISESRFVDIIAQRFDAGVRLGPEVGSGMMRYAFARYGDGGGGYTGTFSPLRLSTNARRFSRPPLHRLSVRRRQPLRLELNVDGKKKSPTRLRDSGLRR